MVRRAFPPAPTAAALLLSRIYPPQNTLMHTLSTRSHPSHSVALSLVNQGSPPSRARNPLRVLERKLAAFSEPQPPHGTERRRCPPRCCRCGRRPRSRQRAPCRRRCARQAAARCTALRGCRRSARACRCCAAASCTNRNSRPRAQLRLRLRDLGSQEVSALLSGDLARCSSATAPLQWRRCCGMSRLKVATACLAVGRLRAAAARCPARSSCPRQRAPNRTRASAAPQ